MLLGGHVQDQAAGAVRQAALDANADARIDGLRAALAILAFTARLAMFFTSRIPKTQPRSTEP